MNDVTAPIRQVRAAFDDETITVYQAYSRAIADPAVESQRFVQPFSLDRMTWIKPSFLWMMYRSGWATKPGQERVLAVRLTRVGFEEALAGACLSHFDPQLYPDNSAWQQRKAETSVRVQWDPERSLTLEPLPWRSLQVGVSGSAIHSYVDHWVVGIEDMTPFVERLRESGTASLTSVPTEIPYPLPPVVMATIGATG